MKNPLMMDYQNDHARRLATARALIAYGAQKSRAARRAKFVRIARTIGKGCIVAGFLVLFIAALCLEPLP